MDPSLGGYDGGPDGAQPPMPDEAKHIEAPEGSIVMYHAVRNRFRRSEASSDDVSLWALGQATWHRQAVNLSAAPRVGLLQAFVPDAVAAPPDPDPEHQAAIEELAGWQLSEQPGSPSSEQVKEGYRRFVETGEAAKLTEREQADLLQLLCGGAAERAQAAADRPKM